MFGGVLRSELEFPEPLFETAGEPLPVLPDEWPWLVVGLSPRSPNEGAS